jgi:hypothetical protein
LASVIRGLRSLKPLQQARPSARPALGQTTSKSGLSPAGAARIEGPEADAVTIHQTLQRVHAGAGAPSASRQRPTVESRLGLDWPPSPFVSPARIRTQHEGVGVYLPWTSCSQASHLCSVAVTHHFPLFVHSLPCCCAASCRFIRLRRQDGYGDFSLDEINAEELPYITPPQVLSDRHAA